MSNPCTWTEPPSNRFSDQLNSYNVIVYPPGADIGALRGRLNESARRLPTPRSENPATRLAATPRKQCRRAAGL